MRHRKLPDCLEQGSKGKFRQQRQRYCVNVPASISPTSRRIRRFFKAKRQAEKYAHSVEDQITQFGLSLLSSLPCRCLFGKRSRISACQLMTLSGAKARSWIFFGVPDWIRAGMTTLSSQSSQQRPGLTGCALLLPPVHSFLQIEHVKRSVILLVSLFYFFLTALTWLLLLRPFQKTPYLAFRRLVELKSNRKNTDKGRSLAQEWPLGFLFHKREVIFDMPP